MSARCRCQSRIRSPEGPPSLRGVTFICEEVPQCLLGLLGAFMKPEKIEVSVV